MEEGRCVKGGGGVMTVKYGTGRNIKTRNSRKRAINLVHRTQRHGIFCIQKLVPTYIGR